MGEATVKRMGKAPENPANRQAVGTMPPDDARELLTVPEAAYMLHISVRSTWTRVWSRDPEKRLDSIYIGSRRYVPRQAVMAYIRRTCEQQGARAAAALYAMAS